MINNIYQYIVEYLYGLLFAALIYTNGISYTDG